jgi:predicted porin
VNLAGVARLSLLTFSIAAIASGAGAQTDNRFAIGAEFKIRTSDHATMEDAAQAQLGPGLLWRFGHGREGWGFHWGLNWYAVNLERSIGGMTTELGELHVRPFMAGYGYTYAVNRRTNVTADILAGYAIGSIGLSPTAIAAYQNRIGAQSVDASSSNTLVLKPEIGVWYDLNRKFGLNVNVGYMIARPEVEVTSSAGTDRRTARADQFSIKVGLVYAIF